MKNKSLSIIFSILMIGALIGGLILVKKNQETRRGAYFAGTKVFMMPEEHFGQVGNEVIAQLFVETEKVGSIIPLSDTSRGCREQCPGGDGVLRSCSPPESDGTSVDSICNLEGRIEACGGKNYCCPSVGGSWTTDMTKCPGGGNYAKLSSIDTQICYGNELAISEDDPASQIELNKEALGTLVDATVVGEGYKCLRLVAIADLNKKPKDLKGGMVRVAEIKFMAVNPGEGEIKIDREKTKVGGYNPTAGATDSALKVGELGDSKYEIQDQGGEVTPTPVLPRSCNQSCGVNSKCEDDLICFPQWWPCSREMPAEILSKTQSAGESLSESEKQTLVQICPEVEGSIPGVMPPILYGVCRNPQCPYKSDCQCQTTSDSVLNYKVAFANVKGNDAKCVVNWPLQFIVLGGGTSKAYSGVIPQSKAVVEGKLVFSGSLTLAGFQRRAGVAVFAKGPKHLQVKYGKNNQEGPYNQAGGEIILTASADTSPVYDFTKYPIIAGDVVGVSSEIPDGWINGVDFSYVKSKSLVHETVNEGGYLKGDLDGNCQVNSNDVNILKISLQAKQGELY